MNISDLGLLEESEKSVNFKSTKLFKNMTIPSAKPETETREFIFQECVNKNKRSSNFHMITFEEARAPFNHVTVLAE